jgi:hypothetical protein
LGASPLGHLDQKSDVQQAAYQPSDRSTRHAGPFGQVDARNLLAHENQFDQSSFVP